MTLFHKTSQCFNFKKDSTRFVVLQNLIFRSQSNRREEAPLLLFTSVVHHSPVHSMISRSLACAYEVNFDISKF